MIGIYKITSPTGRVYVGQSTRIKKRFGEYRNRFKTGSLKCQPKLYNSFKKYGITNHKFEIIELCIKEELNNRERYWQEYYKCLDNGLNCILTSTNDKPLIFSNETKLKLSAAIKGKRKGNKHPLYGKLGKDAPFYGKKHSKETLDKISKIHKGKKLKQYHIDAIANSVRGRKLSESHKQKLNSAKKPLSHKCKPIINIENGIFYDTLREASESLNLNRNTLKGLLNGNANYKNRTPLRYS